MGFVHAAACTVYSLLAVNIICYSERLVNAVFLCLHELSVYSMYWGNGHTEVIKVFKLKLSSVHNPTYKVFLRPHVSFVSYELE